MTPYFFRGSLLVSLGVISFTEFYSMKFRDFIRLEAIHRFRNDMQNKAMNNKKQETKKQETTKQLAGLPTASLDSFGLTDEQKELLNAN